MESTTIDIVPANVAAAPSSVASEAGSFFSSKWFRYGLLVIILAFLGFNIFTYLGKATDAATTAVKPAVKPVLDVAQTAGEAVIDTAEKALDVAAEGVEKVVDVAGDATKQVVNTGALGVEAAARKTAELTSGGIDKLQQISNRKALDDAEKRWNQSMPEPDDALSNTQARQTASQSGYCYIGEQGGVRSCIKVSAHDECMSGDIFPTAAICINPSLRE